MGFLDNLFSSSQSNKKSEKLRLIECVKKNDFSDGGVFVNLYNDLGTYIESAGEHEDSLRKMAYAYARRCAGAGLCAQGIWGEEELSYNLKIFHSFQQLTGQTVEFQETAAAQSIELIESYDSRLKKELVHGIVSMIENSNNPSLAKENGRILTVDELIEMFKK